MRRFNFLIILVILLVGGLVVSQNFFGSKAPSGWQVYKNNNKGFEISFPASWQKEEEEGILRFFDPSQEFLWLSLWFGPTVSHGEEFAKEIKVVPIEIAGILAEKHFLEINKDLFLEERSQEEYEAVKDNKMIFSLLREKDREYFFELVYQHSESEKLFDQFVGSFKLRR